MTYVYLVIPKIGDTLWGDVRVFTTLKRAQLDSMRERNAYAHIVKQRLNAGVRDEEVRNVEVKR